MTKAEIAQKLCNKVGGFSRKEAADMVDDFFDLLKEVMRDGNHLLVTGFGKFTLRDKRARLGRNPKTKERMLLDARRVLTFKPSQLLRKQLNQGNTPVQGNFSVISGNTDQDRQSVPPVSQTMLKNAPIEGISFEQKELTQRAS